METHSATFHCILILLQRLGANAFAAFTYFSIVLFLNVHYNNTINKFTKELFVEAASKTYAFLFLSFLGLGNLVSDFLNYAM